MISSGSVSHFVQPDNLQQPLHADEMLRHNAGEGVITNRVPCFRSIRDIPARIFHNLFTTPHGVFLLMTTCPISSHTRRKSIGVALFLLVLTVAVLLAAGCVTPEGDGNNLGNGTLPAAANSSEMIMKPTPVATICEVYFPETVNDSIKHIAGYPFIYNSTVPNRNISSVRIWIFGEKTLTFTSVPVVSDTFNITLPANQTQKMRGNYRIVFQYPKSGNAFDITLALDQKHQEVHDKQGGVLLDLGNFPKNMTGFEAADILEREIQKNGVDDFSTNLSLIVEQPVLIFDKVNNQTLGDIISLHGRTNLPVGDELVIRVGTEHVTSCPKYTWENSVQNCGDHIPEVVQVLEDSCGNHVWERKIDTSKYGFTPEEYYASADAVKVAVSGYARFTLNPSPIPAATKTTSFSVIRGVPFYYNDTAPSPVLTMQQRASNYKDPDYEKKMAVRKVNVWLFGNHSVSMTTVQVNPEGTFRYVLTGNQTADLTPGTYTILVQYPNWQDLFDIGVRSETGRVLRNNGDLLFLFADVRESKMSGFAAADILKSTMKKSVTGDRFSLATLDVKDS